MLKHKLLRARSGFTLVELLVVIVFIAILIAIAVPNYFASQRRAKASSLMGNMHSNQLAAEAYSVDTGGSYPSAPEDLHPYFPGGASAPGGTNGIFPSNPFSGTENQTPAVCGLNNTMWISLMRNTRGLDNFGGITGQTTYAGIADNQDVTYNNSFAVTGNVDGAAAVQGPNGYAILSNM
jgi:prepilin-type N-terminal cleavage/methylation domain-containing protein